MQAAAGNRGSRVWQQKARRQLVFVWLPVGCGSRGKQGEQRAALKRYQAPGLTADERWTIAVRCVVLLATSVFSQRLPPPLLSMLAGSHAIQRLVLGEMLLR